MRERGRNGAVRSHPAQGAAERSSSYGVVLEALQRALPIRDEAQRCSWVQVGGAQGAP